MTRTRRHIALGVALALGAIEAHGANPPGALDLPPSSVVPAPVDITRTGPAPAERPADPALAAPPAAEPSGNPLWAIPLSTLTATRERPLFTPSRRAPAPAITGPAVVAAPPPPPAPVAAEPERPMLVLVGAIANSTEGYAVFLDQTTNNIVRLRTGQDHDGWVLRSVRGREAILQKDQQSATLALPLPGGASGSALGAGPGGAGPGGAGPAALEGAPLPGGDPPPIPMPGTAMPRAVPLPGGGLGVPRRKQEPEL